MPDGLIVAMEDMDESGTGPREIVGIVTQEDYDRAREAALARSEAIVASERVRAVALSQIIEEQNRLYPVSAPESAGIDMNQLREDLEAISEQPAIPEPALDHPVRPRRSTRPPIRFRDYRGARAYCRARGWTAAVAREEFLMEGINLSMYQNGDIGLTLFPEDENEEYLAPIVNALIFHPCSRISLRNAGFRSPQLADWINRFSPDGFVYDPDPRSDKIYIRWSLTDSFPGTVLRDGMIIMANANGVGGTIVTPVGLEGLEGLEGLDGPEGADGN